MFTSQRYSQCVITLSARSSGGPHEIGSTLHGCKRSGSVALFMGLALVLTLPSCGFTFVFYRFSRCATMTSARSPGGVHEIGSTLDGCKRSRSATLFVDLAIGFLVAVSGLCVCALEVFSIWNKIERPQLRWGPLNRIDSTWVQKIRKRSTLW